LGFNCFQHYQGIRVFRLIRYYLLALAPVLLAGSAAAQTCSVTLSALSQTVSAAGGTGQFNVSSAAGCDWSATSNAPAWLTVQFGQSGSQNGSVGFTVARQDANTARTGTITVNDRTFTVTQSAGSCSYSLSANSASFTAEGGTGSVELDTLRGCAWSATTLATWVTITNPTGTGPSTINYAVQQSTAARSAVVSIQTERLTIQQGAPCSFSVAASIPPVSGNGATVNVAVTASSNTCARTATTTADWIRISSGAVATGNGTVSLVVSPNPTNLPRQATVAINDTLVTISQLGSSCTFTLSPERSTASQTGGVGTINVQTQAGCPWTAVSQVGWIALTGTITGTGNGTVAYSVGQNVSAEQRAGFIAIGSRSFVLTQAGLGCSIRIDNNNLTVGSDGGSGIVSIAALTSCSWSASTSDPWLRVEPATGAGTMDIAFTADANTTSQVRVGRIFVGATEVRVTQAASACRVGVSTTQLSMQSPGGAGQIPITANCAWSARSSVDWIVLTSVTAGSADATLQFQVLANTSSADRTGTITISGQAITVTQTGQRCTLTVSTTAGSIPARGGNGSFNVSGGSSCTWNAASKDPWLQVEFASVSGSGIVRYSAPPNATGEVRTTTVTVSGQVVTIQQPPLVLTISSAGVVNAASFAAAATGVSPGEIITIYGAGFGPALLANLELTANRLNVTSKIGDTRVLFDDVPSPMVYVVEGQLSAIVPYAVAGKQSTVLEVEYLGVKSNAVMLNVAATAPGIFTLPQNGKGQGAVLNQDSSLNGSGTAGAQRNTVIQIFATGDGQSRPNGVDGKLTVTPLPVVVAPVRVFVGGVEAVVTYSGGAPGLVAGLVQINARLAANTPVGDAVSLEVRINAVPSQAEVTIGVR